VAEGEVAGSIPAEFPGDEGVESVSFLAIQPPQEDIIVTNIDYIQLLSFSIPSSDCYEDLS
jgi:hypothetical protein